MKFILVIPFYVVECKKTDAEMNAVYMNNP